MLRALFSYTSYEGRSPGLRADLAFFLRLSRLVFTVQNDENGHQGIQHGYKKIHTQTTSSEMTRTQASLGQPRLNPLDTTRCHYRAL